MPPRNVLSKSDKNQNRIRSHPSSLGRGWGFVRRQNGAPSHLNLIVGDSKEVPSLNFGFSIC